MDYLNDALVLFAWIACGVLLAFGIGWALLLGIGFVPVALCFLAFLCAGFAAFCPVPHNPRHTGTDRLTPIKQQRESEES